jgi:PAS domain-containing protein
MEEKTKEQIIDELRRQITALEAERQQAEQVARETKRHLTRLIESSPDAIISTDKEGNVVLFSEGASC